MTARLRSIAGTDGELRQALEAGDLPTDDIREVGRDFFRVEGDGDQLLGYGGLERYGDVALVRSIVVPPTERGRGNGAAIVGALVANAEERGVKDLYLLTTSAAAFFERLGFGHVDRKDAPETIAKTRQATTICASAALFRLTIAP